MSEINENKVEETGKVEAMNLDAVDAAPVGLGKKILKWGLKALAVVAAAATGFFLGRATGNHDDDSSDEEANDEETT